MHTNNTGPTPLLLNYTLQYPLTRGSDTLSDITIRKPMVGELRGLKLTELLQMDIATCEKLLPRITEMTELDVARLDPYDLTAIMEKVAGFFVLTPPTAPAT